MHAGSNPQARIAMTAPQSAAGAQRDPSLCAADRTRLPTHDRQMTAPCRVAERPGRPTPAARCCRQADHGLLIAPHGRRSAVFEGHELDDCHEDDQITMVLHNISCPRTGAVTVCTPYTHNHHVANVTVRRVHGSRRTPIGVHQTPRRAWWRGSSRSLPARGGRIAGSGRPSAAPPGGARDRQVARRRGSVARAPRGRACSRVS
jgi:hypothetical protein